MGRIHEIVPFLARVYLGKIATLVLLAAIVFQASRIDLLVPFKSIVGRCVLVITALMALSIPTSFWPRQSVMFFQSWPLAFLGVMCVLAGFENARTARLCIAALTIAAGMAAVQLLIGAGFMTGGRAYIGGLAGASYDPNQSAALFVMMLPYAIMFATRPGTMRWVAMPIIPALVAAMIKTGSRGGVLAFGAACLAIVVCSYGRQRKMYILMMGAAVITMGAVDHSALMGRFTELTGGGDYNFTSRDGRWPIWVNGMKLILTHPVVGVGVGAYEVANGTTSGSWKAAHNAYLEIGAELGVLGISAFLMAIVAAFKSAWRLRIVRPGAQSVMDNSSLTAALATASLCSLVGLLVASLFLSLEYQSMTLLALATPTALAWGHHRFQSTTRAQTAGPQPSPRGPGWRSAPAVRSRLAVTQPRATGTVAIGRGRRLK